MLQGILSCPEHGFSNCLWVTVLVDTNAVKTIVYALKLIHNFMAITDCYEPLPLEKLVSKKRKLADTFTLKTEIEM